MDSAVREARTVTTPSEPPARFGYALDRDSEAWDAIDGATREDAARAALSAEQFVDVVFICERQQIDKRPAFALSVKADAILDDADTAASENFCNWFESSIFASDSAALASLEARIVAACADWLLEHPGPEVWVAANVTTHHRDDLAWEDPGPLMGVAV